MSKTNKCVIKVGDKYLSGKGSKEKLVDNVWEARIFNSIGAAKISLYDSYHSIDTSGAVIKEVVIHEKDDTALFEGYFGVDQ